MKILFIMNKICKNKRLPASFMDFFSMLFKFIYRFLSLSVYFFHFFTLFIWVNCWRNIDNNSIDPLYCALVTPLIVECSFIMNRWRRARKKDKCVNILIAPNKNSCTGVDHPELEWLWLDTFLQGWGSGFGRIRCFLARRIRYFFQRIRIRILPVTLDLYNYFSLEQNINQNQQIRAFFKSLGGAHF